jgi:hypothetical protein
MDAHVEGELVDMHFKGQIIGQGIISSLKMLHGLPIPLDHTHLWVTAVHVNCSYQGNDVEVGAPIAWPLIALTSTSGMPTQESCAKEAQTAAGN